SWPGLDTTSDLPDRFRLSASDFTQEVAYLALHLGRPLGQLGDRAEHGLRRAASLSRSFGDVPDAGADRLRAARRSLNITRDLASRGTLLLDRGGNGRGNLVDLSDNGGDALDRGDRGFRLALDGRNLLGDLLGRMRGLVGEVLHFAGHHGESLARLAGAGGFNGRIERQQVGLLGDVGDQLDNVAYFLRSLRQALDLFVGFTGPRRRAGRDIRRALGLTADLSDRRHQLLGRAGYRIDVVAGRVGGGVGGLGFGLGLARRVRHGLGRPAQLAHDIFEALEQAGNGLIKVAAHGFHPVAALGTRFGLGLLLLGEAIGLTEAFFEG